MWFEVLPTFGIITALMGIPTIAYFGVNRLIFDNNYQRYCKGNDYKHYFLRDQRITGKGWKNKKLSESDDI